MPYIIPLKLLFLKLGSFRVFLRFHTYVSSLRISCPQHIRMSTEFINWIVVSIKVSLLYSGPGGGAPCEPRSSRRLPPPRAVFILEGGPGWLVSLCRSGICNFRLPCRQLSMLQPRPARSPAWRHRRRSRPGSRGDAGNHRSLQLPQAVPPLSLHSVRYRQVLLLHWSPTSRR